MPWLGLDIGGANIKVADGQGYATCRPFALWQRPDDLAAELTLLLSDAPECNGLAVTMTGELADCFASKSAGVVRILDAVDTAAAGRPVLVYSTNGAFHSSADARARVQQVAAANWHAVARFARRYAGQQPALMVDIGSTTCDVIPIDADGQVQAAGTDTARLIRRELVYTGVLRTPICGLVDRLPWRGALCPVACEWFATSRDVYLLTGDLREQPADCDTADGRPATQDAARGRIGRMVCADPADVTIQDALAMADQVAAAQTALVAAGIDAVRRAMRSPPAAVVVSGEGEFLARRALAAAGVGGELVSLKMKLGEPVSRCAPAHAVAALASEAAL